MRNLLAFASLTLVMVGAPCAVAMAADTPATTPAVAVPAVDVAFLKNLGGLSEQLLGQANSSLSLAQQAAALPFAGAMAKSKVAAAQSQVASATTLKSEVTGLSQGHTPAATGILGSLASGTGPSLGERFKGLPLAGTLQTVLDNKEMVTALVKLAPLDQVPGYAAASQALAAFAPK
jgi:hypothetical protein